MSSWMFPQCLHTGAWCHFSQHFGFNYMPMPPFFNHLRVCLLANLDKNYCVVSYERNNDLTVMKENVKLFKNYNYHTVITTEILKVHEDRNENESSPLSRFWWRTGELWADTKSCYFTHTNRAWLQWLLWLVAGWKWKVVQTDGTEWIRQIQWPTEVKHQRLSVCRCTGLQYNAVFVLLPPILDVT